ncbi:MAG: MerR family transcriptional regulator [Agathobacter sp.]|nr:MerR family transcriptional regulator [Agathobacter sp.]MBQ2283097.1 MerR family transcriptional regulator [Agathobacter sp.]
MEKVRYMISDAANMVHVETHVLRYWEEELELAIPRNEMGHRYYTRENIRDFQRIKDLKEQGYQLKAIRMILHNGSVEELAPQDQPVLVEQPKNTKNQSEVTSSKEAMAKTSSAQVIPMKTAQTQPIPVKAAVVNKQEITAEERMEQFRELMNDIVGHAISLNNEELSQVIGQEVQERVLKEINYLAREQEEAQEERYKKLDAAIRGNIKKKKIFFKEKDKKKEKKDGR